MATARYRLLSPAGDMTEDGMADIDVVGSTFVLTPSAGDVLRVPFSQIASVTEAERFTVRLALAQGTVIEMSRMGVMRTQVLAELRDAHADAAARAASAAGEADTFSAVADGEQVELRIYDDVLLVVGAAGAQRLSLSFVRSVRTDNYVVTVRATGSDPIELSRLGNRTGEFERALGDRISAARNRTSAFLGALLPGMEPLALRQAAGLLRDGVAVPADTLNGVHADLAGTLLQVATLAERQPAVAELAGLGPLSIGFRQVASVHKEAEGVRRWHDPAAEPHIGEHDSASGRFEPGLAGAAAAGVLAGGPGMLGPAPFRGGPGSGSGSGGLGPGGLGPGGYDTPGQGPGGGPWGYRDDYGGWGGYWAYRALGAGMNGAGMNADQQRQMTSRPDVTRGRLIPAGEDLSVLTVTGEDPTVLGFVLASVPGLVVFDVLNLAEPATLVFRSGGADQVGVINRALVDSGFGPRPAAGSGLTGPPRRAGQPAVLTDLLIGQIPHDGNWSAGLAALLRG